ncbi:FxsA family membrane protein [Streptomyces sp. NPDC020983]|uniref:FxsA family membrane protein n=1 Tax=Streptomyces sp. NPDC020983 TaxID=3365106 RepID=UPI0037AA02D8
MTSSSSRPVRPQPGRQQPQPQPRRRSRARTVVPLTVAAWVVLEIWLMTVIASATSGLVVLLCVVAGFVLGAAAVKRAGRSAWRNLTASVQVPGGETPVPPPAGGGRTGLHMLGGLLLMIPGFLSDAVGLLLLLPPTRRLAGSLAERLARRSLRRHPDAGPGSIGDLFQQAQQAGEQARMHRPDGKVIQGEVIDHRDR